MKKVITVILSVCMIILCSSVFADDIHNDIEEENINIELVEQDEFSEEIIDDNIISEIEEEDITLSKENLIQDINVKIIRQANGSRETIYTGPLSGYANGKWSFMDFTEVEFWTYFDMSWPEDEMIYIIPYNRNFTDNLQPVETDIIEPQDTDKIKSVLERESDEVYRLSTPVNLSEVSNNLSVSTSYKKSGQTLIARFSLINDEYSIRPVQVVAAMYRNGELCQIATAESNIYGWGKWSPSLNVVLPVDMNGISVKFMVWNSQTMSPYSEIIEFNDTGNIENEIFLNKPVQALANNRYLFRPKRNGVYSFTEDTNVTIYRKAFGTLIQMPANSVLTYPNRYYVEVSSNCNMEARVVGNYLPGDPFNIGMRYFIVADGDAEFYADWNNGGEIYKTESGISSCVCRDKASWLEINGDYIYYHNLLDNGRIYRIEKNAVNEEHGEFVQE